MRTFDPWATPEAVSRPRPAATAKVRLSLWRVVAGAFVRTSDAERPGLLNFVAGASGYVHVQKILEASSLGVAGVQVASMALLVGVVNLRAWCAAAYVLLAFADGSTGTRVFRGLILVLAVLFARRFRW